LFIAEKCKKDLFNFVTKKYFINYSGTNFGGSTSCLIILYRMTVRIWISLSVKLINLIFTLFKFEIENAGLAIARSRFQRLPLAKNKGINFFVSTSPTNGETFKNMYEWDMYDSICDYY